VKSLCRRINFDEGTLIHFAKVFGTNGQNSPWRSIEDPRAIRSCRGARGVTVRVFLIISSGEIGSLDPSQRGQSNLP
jgi:hypothetical protein